MAEEEVGLRITATDEASPVLDDVADRLDDLDDPVEVAVDADTGDARSAIDRFADELDDLTGDAREVRIEFKQQQLERDIRNILRDLERLEDPAEIAVRSGDLDVALADLNDLKQVASERFEVDLDVDPARTARQAVDDVENLRQRGEGLQSAIPAIRGFGDELGATAQGAGIASQAVADLGDFALIAGERFTTEGSRMAGVATRLGTALGVAGLGGALAGIAVQLGQQVLPAIADWIGGTEDAVEANEELADSARDVATALDEQRYADAVRTLIDSNRDLFDSAHLVEGGADALTKFLLGMSNSLTLNGNVVGDVSDRWNQLTVDARFLRTEIRDTEEAVADENEMIRANATALLEAETRTDSAATRLARYRDEVADVSTTSAGAATDTAELADEMVGLASDTSRATRSVDAADAAIGRLRGSLDVADAADRFETAMGDAFTAVATGADDAEEKVRRAKDTALDYLEALGNIPPSVTTAVVALIDQGKLDQVHATLKALETPLHVPLTVTTEVVGASGFPVPALPTGNTTTGGRAATNVTLNLPASDGRSVTREVARWARVNG